MTEFYARPSLHVEAYDALHGAIPGGADLAFFRDLAERSGGPVLELGCGSGRLTIPLAEAGIDIVGLDRSAAMLDRARARRAALAPEVRRRVRFVEGDMTDFRLGRRFGLIFAAFRVFMSLLDSESQRASLAAIRRHLRSDGRLSVDLFDPRLDLLGPGRQPGRSRMEAMHPVSGNRVVAAAVERDNDVVRQVLTEQWRFVEEAPDGTIVREEREELRLRWTFRHEMRHLLELARFEVLSEHSDYAGAGPAYGREQIWLARPARRPGR
ncbi:MAG TPA: class I SAM-dependent methyltransferase [Patescibacteria group bacterium]|nr:class I SAM-dependent methyltransferase [Patescibacteria group bacterium]